MWRCTVIVFTFSLLIAVEIQAREFKIDYAKNRFLKDGKPFQYASGSIHYFRVPPEYWRDRLLKLRAAGFNTVQTYVPWNLHEPYPGRYNFEKEADLVKFLRLAQETKLHVILRPGPYIDSEWDMGGLPWWLLKNGSSQIALRTSDPAFVSALERWFGELLPRMKPLLYQNGGSMIMVQVENEYGSYYACDRNYMAIVRDLLRQHLGHDAVLFTTDGGADSYLKCGVVDGVYPTVDFGTTSKSGVQQAFNAQRHHTPNGGPLVNSEYYPGWFDTWGGKHARIGETPTIDTIKHMWAMKASFNLYMFHGGTNFAYWAGAFSSPAFSSVTTSYDYDAPLSEAGDLTPKWHALRTTLLALTKNRHPDPIPRPMPKKAYGKVQLRPVGTILELLPVLCPPDNVVTSLYPLTMEQVDHPYGYILYETTLGSKVKSLSFKNIVRDRAHVLIDGRLVKVIDREGSNQDTIDIGAISTTSSTLQVLVENRGRVCVGRDINDAKGLVGNVTADNKVLKHWKIYPIRLTHLNSKILSKTINSCQDGSEGFLPTVYAGTINIDGALQDTFLDTTGWSKGQAFVNGRNIGRYWPARGPQMTLYVPAPGLHRPAALVMLFETEKPGNCQTDCSCFVSFADRHKLTKGKIGG